jgi:electron transfer flavoprotein beta subunit
MKIIVLAKQVPDSTEITVDKATGTLVRDGVPSIMNPDDLSGLEAALEIKDSGQDVEVVVVSMGPPQAAGMLQEAIARGADKAYLLTDRRLGGADTCATSRTLAAVLDKIGYDLIIAGRQAIDGDTAQVGPQTAERLGIPQVTYVDQIVELANDHVKVKKALEDEEQIVSVTLPAVITTLSGMNKPRYMNCNDIVDSFSNPVVVLTYDDLKENLPQSEVGLAGSPTQVYRTFTKDVTAATETFNLPAAEAGKQIASNLKNKQLIKK